MPDIELSKYEKIAKFDSTLVENMSILSNMDNYYSWIASALMKYSGNRVLDIGCAQGNLTQFFINKELIIGVDYSKDYIKQINERFKGKKNFKSILLDITNSKSAIMLKKHKFDTIVTMNTYEHIKNDEIAFKNAFNILEKNGRMLVFVPAGLWLYSILDFEGGHFRRYIKSELKAKMQEAGFKMEKLFYFNVPGALGWYFFYVLLKQRIYNAGTFSLYNKLVPLFKFLESKIKPPFGLSLLAVGKKE